MARDYDAAFDSAAEEEYLSQAEYEEMMAEAFEHDEPDSALEEELDAYYDDPSFFVEDDDGRYDDDPSPYDGNYSED